jgi:hypothetical protein
VTDRRIPARAMVALGFLALAYSAADAGGASPGERTVLVLTGWAGLLAMLPILRRAALRFTPPLLPWPAAPLAHLPVSMLFSAGHVAIAAALRLVAFSATGEAFDPLGPSPAGTFLAAYRFDLIFYTAAVATLLIARRDPQP